MQLCHQAVVNESSVLERNYYVSDLLQHFQEPETSEMFRSFQRQELRENRRNKFNLGAQEDRNFCIHKCDQDPLRTTSSESSAVIVFYCSAQGQNGWYFTAYGF